MIENSYYEIVIKCGNVSYDRLYSALYLSGIDKFLEEDNILTVYFLQNETDKIDEMKNILFKYASLSKEDITVHLIKNKDWNEEYKKTIEPVYIKDKIVIYPSWKKNVLSETDSRILIEIDPKMSFGTGHNETTRLMLELMCDYISEDDNSMLDFGCGTGILAIFAAKSGIKKIIAIDIDDDAIENAEEYIRINGCTKFIKLYKSDITGISGTGFDVICANILADVIKEKLYCISEKLSPEGKLFLSGILKEQENDMIAVLRDEYDIIDIQREKEWVGIYTKKKLGYE